MALTHNQIEHAKPTDKQLSDGLGLYLLLNHETGRHGWRFNFKKPSDHKRSTISLGSFPDVSLAKAREDRDMWRKLVAEGKDPAVVRKKEKRDAAVVAEQRARIRDGKAPHGSFRHACEEMVKDRNLKKAWVAHTAKNFMCEMKKRVFPALGMRQCADLDMNDFLDISDALVAKGKWGMARRALQGSAAVMGHAQRLRFIKGSPLAQLEEMDKLLGLNPEEKVSHAGVTSPEDLRDLMLRVNQIDNDQARRLAWLQCQTFQRPRNCYGLQWDHIKDLHGEKPQFVIPGALMKRLQKNKRISSAPHIVPIAKQTVAILKEQREYLYNVGLSESPYVFPNRYDRNKHMCHSTLSKKFLEVGVANTTQTAHGFRATARTMCDEQLAIDARFLEAHLAHAGGVNLDKFTGVSYDATNGLGATYARATYVEQRRVMVQVWADYIDTLVYGDEAKAKAMTEAALAKASGTVTV